MPTYLVKRFLLMVVTLFGVAVVNFAIIHLAPGGPVQKKSPEEIERGLQATATLSIEERTRREFHLHKPVILNLRPFRDHEAKVREWIEIRARIEHSALWDELVRLRQADEGAEREAALEALEERADDWKLVNLVDSARHVAVDQGWLELFDLYRSNVTTIVEEARKRLLDLERWAIPALLEILAEDRDRALGILVLQTTARHLRGEPWEVREDDSPAELRRKLREFEDWWTRESAEGRVPTATGEAVGRWLGEQRGALHALDESLRLYLRREMQVLFARERLADARNAGEGIGELQAELDRLEARLTEVEEPLVRTLSAWDVSLPEAAIREEILGPSRGRNLEAIRWRVLLDATRFLARERSDAIERNDVGGLVRLWLEDRDPRIQQTVVNVIAQIREDDRNVIYAGESHETAAEKRRHWEAWWEEERGDYTYGSGRKIWFLFTDTQFASYMWDLVRLDLGKSFKAGREPVSGLIWQHFQVSFLLMLLSSILIYATAIPLGIYSSVRQGSLVDKTSMVVLFILYSVPSYVAAVFLLRVFSTGNPWNVLPTDRLTSPGFEGLTTLGKVADYAHHLVLPVLCLTYTGLASISRYARVGMLEVIRQDYIRTARAKGLPENVVVLKHALRNGVIPLITIFANLLPVMVGGSVIIENIFSIQGMGYLAFHSITERDYTTLMGINLITAVLVMLGILVSDLLYAVVDPRISFD